jgi:predicted DNA-binding protein
MRRSPEGRYTKMIGARLNEELLAKLQALGQQTQRDKADVIRLLIRNAQVGAPDLSSTVDPQPPEASAVAAELSA